MLPFSLKKKEEILNQDEAMSKSISRRKAKENKLLGVQVPELGEGISKPKSVNFGLRLEFQILVEEF